MNWRKDPMNDLLNNVNKEFLPKSFKKILPKIYPKKYLSDNSSKKVPKNAPKNPKEIQKIPKILKISNSLYCTWRPKTLSGLFS